MNYLERRIEFHGDQILTFQDQKTGKVYVAVAMICNSLGMTENQINSQRQKIQSDETLKLGFKKFTVNLHGQSREHLFIELQFLTGWLFKINPARFDEKLKDKLIDYQLHCQEILTDEFFGKRATFNLEKIEFNPMMKEAKQRIAKTETIEAKIRSLFKELKHEYERIEHDADVMLREIKKVEEGNIFNEGYLETTLNGEKICLKTIEEIDKFVKP